MKIHTCVHTHTNTHVFLYGMEIITQNLEHMIKESPVASAIIDPFSGAKAFIIRAPVEQTGIAVQRVEQVQAGPDHSERERHKRKRTQK